GQVNGAPAVLGLAHDLEIRFTLEQAAHPHPKQGVVVDQEDLGDLPDGSAIGSASSPIGTQVVQCAHSISLWSGIANVTMVPPVGREPTSKRAPISSARSRMNW